MAACPLAYRMGAARIRRCPVVSAQTVFAVGGLYGNSAALRAVMRRASTELGVAPQAGMGASTRSPCLVVFNGANWVLMASKARVIRLGRRRGSGSLYAPLAGGEGHRRGSGGARSLPDRR
jgi:hypothetical protein